MSTAKRMGSTARIDKYAAAKGWTPDMLPKQPPEMTPRQFRRFLAKHKLGAIKRDARSKIGPYPSQRITAE